MSALPLANPPFERQAFAATVAGLQEEHLLAG